MKKIYTQDFVFSLANRSDNPGAIRFQMDDPEGNTFYIDVSAAEAFKLSSRINNLVKPHLESV
jgi:hypothetical protein